MMYSLHNQRGVVLGVSLLLLVVLTILGSFAVDKSTQQNIDAVTGMREALTFQAAESAIAGVLFEAEDPAVQSSATMLGPLAEARLMTVINPALTRMACNDNAFATRRVTQSHLQSGQNHTGTGKFLAGPDITAWSRVAFVREQNCAGASAVIGGSNFSCHVFIVKGCALAANSPIVNTAEITASVIAPATQ